MSIIDKQYSTDRKEKLRLGYMPFIVLGFVVLAVVIIFVALRVSSI